MVAAMTTNAAKKHSHNREGWPLSNWKFIFSFSANVCCKARIAFDIRTENEVPKGFCRELIFHLDGTFLLFGVSGIKAAVSNQHSAKPTAKQIRLPQMDTKDTEELQQLVTGKTGKSKNCASECYGVTTRINTGENDILGNRE